MSTDTPNRPWHGSTYSGFAGPAVAAVAPAAPASRARPRTLSQPLMLGGVAAAVAAGVALGFVAQPRETSAASAEASATPLPVELAAPAPAPAMPAAGKLDVRPAQEASPAATVTPQPVSAPAARPDARRPELPAPPRVVDENDPPTLELERQAEAPDEAETGPEVYDEVEPAD